MSKPALTIIDVILEAMPFSDELVEWCHVHPDFLNGLKFTNNERFLPLGIVSTSKPPPFPEHEAIGFFVYDMEQERLKQDYIVKVDNEFFLYSKVPDKKYGKYVQHINHFFAKYGDSGKYYVGTHYPPLEELEAYSVDVKERVQSTLRIAASIQRYGYNNISQGHLQEALDGIRQQKALQAQPTPVDNKNGLDKT